MLFQYILKYIGRILYHLMPNKLNGLLLKLQMLCKSTCNDISYLVENMHTTSL
jgi:hypothetical protein